jgi:hypothetical protein
MIANLVRKDELRTYVEASLGLIREIREKLAANDPKVNKLAKKYGWTVEDFEQLEKLFEESKKGFELPDDTTFIPSDEELSFVQTLLERGYTKTKMVDESSGQGLAEGVPVISGRTLKEQAKPPEGQGLYYTAFDEPNARYATEWIQAFTWRLAHRKRKFSESPKTVPIADRCRIVLVGDWGTGIERADLIADLMRKALDEASDRERHAVHLGDIYFSGWPEECQKRFLDHWPVTPAAKKFVKSWCLNGNHDMYSGGYGYFDTVLNDARFAEQGKCSYFMLENSHWQLFGLDTAYEEWEFHKGQIDWAARQRDANPGKKGILMTHHQPFKYGVPDDAKSARLAKNARSMLLGGRTTAWVWGHEHRGVVYKPITFDFKDGTTGTLPIGSCIGHGGVPAQRTDPSPNTLYAVTEQFSEGYEQFGLFGFGILDIDGPSATLTMVDERNNKSDPIPIA